MPSRSSSWPMMMLIDRPMTNPLDHRLGHEVGHPAQAHETHRQEHHPGEQRERRRQGQRRVCTSAVIEPGHDAGRDRRGRPDDATTRTVERPKIASPSRASGAAYSPTSGGRPATPAMPIDSGIRSVATETPAMTSSRNHCPHWYPRSHPRQGTWRARNPSWLVLVAIDQTSLVTVRKVRGALRAPRAGRPPPRFHPRRSPTSRSRSRPRDGAASCVPRGQESAASRRSPEPGPRSRPPGCPAMRTRRETQIACPRVHRFLPSRRTRTGMSPGRLRSFRLFKKIARIPRAHSHSGTRRRRGSPRSQPTSSQVGATSAGSPRPRACSCAATG